MKINWLSDISPSCSGRGAANSSHYFLNHFSHLFSFNSNKPHKKIFFRSYFDNHNHFLYNNPFIFFCLNGPIAFSNYKKIKINHLFSNSYHISKKLQIPFLPFFSAFKHTNSLNSFYGSYITPNKNTYVYNSSIKILL